MKSISYKERYTFSGGGQKNFIRIVECENDYDISENPIIETEEESIEKMRDFIDQSLKHRDGQNALVIMSDGTEIICSSGSEFMSIMDPNP